MIDHAAISLKSHIFSEPFTVKPLGGSSFNLIGMWDDADTPNNFSGIVVANDSPSIDFLTSECSLVKKKTEITRVADSQKYYVIDVSPDDGGITTFRVSRNCPQ